MENNQLEYYWNDIPVGERNAIQYSELIAHWGKPERKVRQILHELSLYDNGDDYILIRSSKSKGFYKTDEPKRLEEYKKECLNKGKSVFAPVKKINRVLRSNTNQINFTNNLRVLRESKKLKQSDVCRLMGQYECAIDIPMLSKMENGVCLPNPLMLIKLAEIYECATDELIKTDIL